MHKSQFSILLGPSCSNHNRIFNLFLAFTNSCSLYYFNCFYLAQCIRDSKFRHQWILWQSFHHPPQSKNLLLILGEWARKMGCACMMALHQLSSHAKVRLISKNIMLTYMAISFCKMLPFVLFSSQLPYEYHMGKNELVQVFTLSKAHQLRLYPTLTLMGLHPS